MNCQLIQTVLDDDSFINIDDNVKNKQINVSFDKELIANMNIMIDNLGAVSIKSKGNELPAPRKVQQQVQHKVQRQGRAQVHSQRKSLNHNLKLKNKYAIVGSKQKIKHINLNTRDLVYVAKCKFVVGKIESVSASKF